MALGGPIMSAALSIESEVTSSQVPATATTIFPSIEIAKVAAPAHVSPVNGFVGHCFVRICLWADLLASWTRRSHLPGRPLKSAFRIFGGLPSKMKIAPPADSNSVRTVPTDFLSLMRRCRLRRRRGEIYLRDLARSLRSREVSRVRLKTEA